MKDWSRKHDASPSREGDLKMLRKLLEKYTGDLDESEVAAFTDMWARVHDTPGAKLSEKQRAWAQGVLDRFEPVYENLISSGAVSGASTVATIELLKPENLPKKPPARR